VISLYWVAHLRGFRFVRSYDRRLLYLNFLFLLFIAFMPFPTGLSFSTRHHRYRRALFWHCGRDGPFAGRRLVLRCGPSLQSAGPPADYRE